jgi:dolichol-phosphate mannosyltransferase
VGGSGVVVNLGALYLLVEYEHMDKTAAWFLAMLLSILSNFLLNDRFTYGDRLDDPRLKRSRRAAYFCMASLLVLTINYSVYALALARGLTYLYADLFGIAVSTVFNFFIADRVIWKKQ